MSQLGAALVGAAIAIAGYFTRTKKRGWTLFGGGGKSGDGKGKEDPGPEVDPALWQPGFVGGVQGFWRQGSPVPFADGAKHYQDSILIFSPDSPPVEKLPVNLGVFWVTSLDAYPGVDGGWFVDVNFFGEPEHTFDGETRFFTCWPKSGEEFMVCVKKEIDDSLDFVLVPSEE